MIVVHRHHERTSADRGDTLIEILMTVVIMGITVTAILGGLTLLITGADSHRRLADVEVLSRSYGEKIVDQATHPKSTKLAADASAGTATIVVASSTNFASLAKPFSAAVDGEVVSVKKIVGTTWTLDSNLADAHDADSVVVQYQSCPAGADLFVSGFTPPSDSKVVAPTVANITKVEYFDRQGAPVTAAACPNYWDTTAQPCKAFETNDHLTECDPVLIRVSFKLQSSDAAEATGATAPSSVLIRRGNT